MTPCFRGVSARNFAEKLRESFRCFSASFRGASPPNLAEKKSGLFELMRNLAEFSSRKFAFENFVRGVNAKKMFFFLGLICMSDSCIAVRSHGIFRLQTMSSIKLELKIQKSTLKRQI